MDDGQTRHAHPPLTVAQYRIQRMRWRRSRLRNFVIWGGLISYLLFCGALWYNIHVDELGGAHTTNFWMVINMIFLGLVWISIALLALVGTILPTSRRKMLLPLAMHLVFAGAITPNIVRFVEVFQVFWAPPKPNPIPETIYIPGPVPAPTPATSPSSP